MIDATSPFAHLFSDSPTAKALKGQAAASNAEGPTRPTGSSQDFAAMIAALTGPRDASPSVNSPTRPALQDVVRSAIATPSPPAPVSETPTEAGSPSATAPAPVAETPNEAAPVMDPPVAERPAEAQGGLTTNLAELVQAQTAAAPVSLPGVSPFMNGAQAIFAALTNPD